MKASEVLNLIKIETAGFAVPHSSWIGKTNHWRFHGRVDTVVNNNAISVFRFRTLYCHDVTVGPGQALCVHYTIARQKYKQVQCPMFNVRVQSFIVFVCKLHIYDVL